MAEIHFCEIVLTPPPPPPPKKKKKKKHHHHPTPHPAPHPPLVRFIYGHFGQAAMF